MGYSSIKRLHSNPDHQKKCCLTFVAFDVLIRVFFCKKIYPIGDANSHRCDRKGDRIKRLKLRCCGKLDFTCNGKLRPPQFFNSLKAALSIIAYCHDLSTAAPQYTSRSSRGSKKSTATSRVIQLVYCGSRSRCRSAAA